MAGRGRLYVIGAGGALLLFIAGGAFVASRAGEQETAGATTNGAAAAAAATANEVAPSAASPGAAPAEGPGAANAAPSTSRDWAAATAGTPASASLGESGAPATPLVETVNADPPVAVQVLSAKRITPDTVRVELALVNRSSSPEALDLRGLTVAPGSAAGGKSGGAAGKPAASHPLGLTDLCLLTTDNSRRLFALRDDQDKPVGSGDFAPLGPNERRVIWAVFPAPPAAHTHATLLVGAVAVQNVPIS